MCRRPKWVRRPTAALMLVVAIVACAAPAGPTGEISGRLVAGPVCPVESLPPDPACAPRPVEDALITIVSSAGREWRVRSDDDGYFRVKVPIGEVLVLFGPVKGLMGTPPEIGVEVTEGETTNLGEVAYDTGIR